MKKMIFLMCVATATIIWAAGCDSKQSNSNNAANATSANEHDHTVDTDDNRHAVEGHSHGEGPHGGTIADWGGGKFHVEFTVDHGQQQATAYILGDDEKTPVPVDAKEISLAIKEPDFQISLAASPQGGDPEGKSSRFVANHENFGIVQEYQGSMSGVVDGIPYSGNFKEVQHDH